MPVRLMALHPIHSTCVHGQSGMSEGGGGKREGVVTENGGSDLGGVHAEVEVIYATAAPLLRPDRQLSGSERRNFRHERTSERPAATNAEREGIEIMDASDEGDTPTACSNRQQKSEEERGREEEDCAVLTARCRRGAPPTRRTRSPTKS